MVPGLGIPGESIHSTDWFARPVYRETARTLPVSSLWTDLRSLQRFRLQPEWINCGSVSSFVFCAFTHRSQPVFAAVTSVCPVWWPDWSMADVQSQKRINTGGVPVTPWPCTSDLPWLNQELSHCGKFLIEREDCHAVGTFAVSAIGAMGLKCPGPVFLNSSKKKISPFLPRVRIELTTLRLWDLRAAYCAIEAGLKVPVACLHLIDPLPLVRQSVCCHLGEYNLPMSVRRTTTLHSRLQVTTVNTTL